MNKLITIGGINSNISYLNISREDAILRYSKEWKEKRIIYSPKDAEVSEFEFKDSFTFYDI